jgi:hypothetical protein
MRTHLPGGFFGVSGGLGGVASLPPAHPSIASPEPRRSTSVPGTEVLRRGSGEVPARPAGRSGAGLGNRGPMAWLFGEPGWVSRGCRNAGKPRTASGEAQSGA